MKQNEKEIIKIIRSGKKVNMSEIARELDIPVTTATDRVKRISDKYVNKHSVILDYHKAGYTANAIVAIKARERKNELFDFLKEDNNVNSLFHTNSDFHFLVELVCKDNLELYSKLDNLKNVYGCEVTPYHILKTEEREKFIPK